MENETPFDLEKELRKWREQLSRSASLREEEAEELELHLRDAVTVLKAKGLSDEEALWVARKRLGVPEILDKEFSKVITPKRFIAGLLQEKPTDPAALRRVIRME